mgnify:CR=1 FL=1
MSASVKNSKGKAQWAAARAEKQSRFAEFRRIVSAMSEDDRAALAARMPIVNTEGHALSAFNNCLLIQQAAGMPLTIVGGFRQWLAAGRVVAAGQHGLMIWYPRGKRKAAADSDDTESGAMSFGTATVFDISQTVPRVEISVTIGRVELEDDSALSIGPELGPSDLGLSDIGA